MADVQTQTSPFLNKGVNLKQEPSTLPQGEFAQLTNLISTQEGELDVRLGSQLYSNSGSFGGASIIGAISKLHISEGDDVRYYAGGTRVFRDSTPLPTTSAISPTLVAHGVAPSTLPYPLQRVGMAAYNAGTIGTPYQYFACPLKMLKDNGTLNSGDGSGDGTILQKWGIVPPTSPVVATLDKLTILPGTDVIQSVSGLSPGNRLTTSISSVTGPTSGAGFYTCQVGSLTGIYAGTLLSVAGQLVAVTQTSIDSMGNQNFSAYFTSRPSGSVTASEVNSGLNTAPTSAVPYYFNLFEFPIAVTGAGFDGLAPDYTTSDVVHVAIGIAEPTKISDIRLRVMVGASYNSAGPDYYEKSIAISALQPITTLTQTAATNLTTTIPQTVIGVYGPYQPPSEETQAAQAVQLGQASPNQSTGNSVYSEVDVPKNTFTAVGQAGGSNFTWKNIVGFQVLAISSVTTAEPTVWVSSIYIAGGFGPNALSQDATVVLQPYDYLYTFVNPTTGAQSNPCVPMIQNNWLTPQRQRVALALAGTGDPQVDPTSKASIAVYRRGGSFSDGLYRLIGYAQNPGLTTSGGVTYPSDVIFYDNQSDISLVNAPLIQFDNDPPVLSTLPNPARFTFAFYAGGGNGIAGQGSLIGLTTVNSLPAANIGSFLTPGTKVTFAPGTPKQEDVYISGVETGTNVVQVFFQYDHTDFTVSTNVIAYCDAVTNQPCSLVLEAFDSLFVAGDPNNPHVVYKSKTGLPESFPVVELATGIVDQQNVGTPSNPIVNFCEYGGGLVFLNLKNIFFMAVAYGVMEAPIATPATRGLIGRNAWCLVDNEIWYVSYDGIYSWSGGQSIKRSEPLNPLFNGESIGPYRSIRFGPNPNNTAFLGSDIIEMVYHDNQVIVSYIDQIGDYYRLRYDTIYGRWSIDYYWDPSLTQPPPKLPIPGGATPPATTAMYHEDDTGLLLSARTVSISTTLAFVYVDEYGTSDGWTGSNQSSGSAIPFTVSTPSFTLGAPSTNKQYLDYVLELKNDSMVNLSWAAYYDFSATPDATDSGTFLVPSPAAGRHRVPVSLQNGYGKEAYAASLVFQGSSVNSLTLYSLTFNFIPLTQVQSGRTWDWDELGYRYDKRLYQLILEYDIPVGQTATMVLDTITGIAGSQTENTAVQTFTLSPPTSGVTGVPTRLTANFHLIDVLIVKKVRIRPVSTNPITGVVSSNPVLFKYFSYTFGDFEKLPPDIVAFTPWSNYGSDYDKYAQQIDLDVDTGGVAASCTLQADGATVAGPFTVTTNSENRHVNLTMPPQIIGKQFRLLNVAGSGGRFQLYDHKIIFLPADKGPVYHSYDFDDLGYQYTKKLIRWTVEYDTSNAPTTILMDILSGIKGETLTTAAFSFVLDGTGRSLQSFNFPDNTFAKMIRFYPQSDRTTFKEWKYRFDKLDYPPDISLFTEYTDFGYPCEKIARNLILDIDTGGVAASIALVADGATMETFSVTTNDVDRSRIIATNSELIGRLWKLELTPGSGGMTELFTWKLDFVREPCQILYYDTYQTDFGYDGWKWVKQGWFWYAAPAGLFVTMFTDDEQTFYEFELPAQANRDLARVYFPAIQFSNGQPVLNKSKVYRLQISSASKFKLYAGSRLEWMPVAGDQRQAFQQFPLGQEQQLPVQQLQTG